MTRPQPDRAATDGIVAKVDQARRLLAEARDAGQAKQIADIAHAAEIFARRQKLSQEAIEYATAVKIDAMTMMGEFLKQAPKNEGARGNPGGQGAKIVRSQSETAQLPTLADAGISKRESSDAQMLATVKEEAPELYADARAGKKKLSQVRDEMRRPATRKPPPPAPEPINRDVQALIGQLSSLAESLSAGRSFFATARTYKEEDRWALADRLEELSTIMYRRATELRNRA